MSKEQVFLGTGRRKNAIARVRLTRGSGKISVNGKDFEEYFYTDQLAGLAAAPLNTVEMRNDVDIIAKTHSGGINGQASAVALGVARALESMDETLRAPLKAAGHMTRDPRMKERKKSGQPGARKRFQFSKR